MLELASLLLELELEELALLPLNPRARPLTLAYSSLEQRRRKRSPNLHLRLSVAIKTLRRNRPIAAASQIHTMRISKTLTQLNLAEPSQQQDSVSSQRNQILSKRSLIRSAKNQTHSQTRLKRKLHPLQRKLKNLAALKINMRMTMTSFEQATLST